MVLVGYSNTSLNIRRTREGMILHCSYVPRGKWIALDDGPCQEEMLSHDSQPTFNRSWSLTTEHITANWPAGGGANSRVCKKVLVPPKCDLVETSPTILSLVDTALYNICTSPCSILFHHGTCSYKLVYQFVTNFNSVMFVMPSIAMMRFAVVEFWGSNQHTYRS